MNEIYMNIALSLAQKGAPYTLTNPRVGAVCVKKNEIISTGYHSKFGNLHAERITLMKDLDYKNADLYVNLEPCSHTGKTPPCTDIIIEKGIKRVYIAHSDPNPYVSGIKILRENRIKVITGILKEKALKINQAFLCNIKEKRPYITLKIATSLDGKIATENKKSKYISSQEALILAHQLRSENDAILVGIETVLTDNPLLTIRHASINKKIKRIILDSSLKIPLSSNLVKTFEKGNLIIFTSKSAPHEKIKKLEDSGIEVLKINKDNSGLDIDTILKKLYQRNIGKLLVEGGCQIASTFLKKGKVDRLIQAISLEKILGGSQSYTKNIFYNSPEQGEIIKNYDFYNLDKNIIIEGAINVYRDN